MNYLSFIIGLLSAWRITHLLQAEDGPFDLIFRFRKLLGKSFFGKLMDCFYCLSIWISVPFALYFGEIWQDFFLLTLAFSGGSILLERLTNKNFNNNHKTEYYED